MSDAIQFEEILGDLPFFEIEAALRAPNGGDGGAIASGPVGRRRRDEALDALLKVVSDRVAAAIQRKFPHALLDDDATQSACRTFLRRMKIGAFELESPQDIVKLLVRIAYRKAIRASAGSRRELVSLDAIGDESQDRRRDPAGTLLFGDGPSAEDERQATRLAMAQQLEHMISRAHSHFHDAAYNAVFQLWYEQRYGGKRTSQLEMSKQVGRSVRTVRRYVSEIEAFWENLVDEARRELESAP